MSSASTQTSWREIKLSEVCSRVTVGHVGPMKDEYVGSGIPFLRSQNIQPFRINHTNLKYVTPEFHHKLRKSALGPGDVVIVRTGYPGTAAVIPSSMGVANCADLVIVTASEHLNPYFLSAFFNSKWGQAIVAGRLVGVAQQHFNVSAAKETTIRLPTRTVQDKITSILSAYDDLIETNLRRIKILEEMARNLYREWFANFRFPGHEKVRMVDSELGKVPEGWEFKKLADACELVMGQSPKSEFYNETGEGLPFHQGVTNFGARFPKHKIYCTVENRIAEAGDILFSVRAPVGRINIANTRIVVGRGIAAIRNQDSAQWFLFHQLKDRFQEEDTIGGGTIFKAVTKTDMQNIDFLQPTANLVNLFESHCDPLSSQIENLTARNELLRETRELLLPKLISGELDVSELDIEVPEKAA